MTCTAYERGGTAGQVNLRKEAEHDEEDQCARDMPGVTREQIRQARETDLFRYLQFHELGVLKRDDPELPAQGA